MPLGDAELVGRSFRAGGVTIADRRDLSALNLGPGMKMVTREEARADQKALERAIYRSLSCSSR